MNTQDDDDDAPYNPSVVSISSAGHRRPRKTRVIESDDEIPLAAAEFTSGFTARAQRNATLAQRLQERVLRGIHIPEPHQERAIESALKAVVSVVPFMEQHRRESLLETGVDDYVPAGKDINGLETGEIVSAITTLRGGQSRVAGSRLHMLSSEDDEAEKAARAFTEDTVL